MCCRYYYEDFERELRELMRAEAVVQLSGFDSGKLSDRDVSPSQSAVTIHAAGPGIAHATSGLGASKMYWGFTNPYKKGLVINARSETASEKKLFADSMANRRCLIPASGFYEWDANKARYRFYRKDELVWLAGIYRAESGMKKFTVLTRDAAGSMIGIHDRMPLTVEDNEVQQWIGDQDYADHIIKREPGFLLREQDAGQISMDLF